jgi:hypothetical protein
MCFGRVVLEVAIRDLVTAFAAEEAKVVVHLTLAFLFESACHLSPTCWTNHSLEQIQRPAIAFQSPAASGLCQTSCQNYCCWSCC